jgi:geranylgeranyl pyrophosphate synthase
MVKELSAWKSRAEKAEAILTEYQRRERVVVEELETIRELVRNVGGEAEMFSWDHATTALATLRKPVGER